MAKKLVNEDNVSLSTFLYDVYKNEEYLYTSTKVNIEKKINKTVYSNKHNEFCIGKNKYRVINIGRASDYVDFAVYKGDRILFVGTKKEISKKFNMSDSTVRFYMSSYGKKRSLTSDSAYSIYRVGLNVNEIERFV